MANKESLPQLAANRPSSRLALITLATALLLVAIFAGMVVRFRTELREDIRQKIIGRDAAVLYPFALQQVAEAEAANPGTTNPSLRLAYVFKSANQRGMLGVAVFDEEGRTVQAVPATMLFVELPADDYLRLLGGTPLSRYHDSFPLDRYFTGIAPQRTAPVLEILLPLYGQAPDSPIGFVRYYIDALPLSLELSAIDQRIRHQTDATLIIGISLIATVLGLAYLGLRRAQNAVSLRNEQLTRANFELTLAAKASALGQITSHLIHGLQGSVAGLRSVVASHDQPSSADWQSAAGYTERMQSLIQETVGLLGDIEAQTRYELTGRELAETIRQRNLPQATRKGVLLSVRDNFQHTLDSHRGSLVSDQGAGIPDAIRNNLFKPGRTTKPGGTGLGLAISQLLARQIGAELTLAQTGPTGTTFKLKLPLALG